VGNPSAGRDARARGDLRERAAHARRSDAAYFRWFLASLLFGARISETTAKNTYRSFIRHGLTNPTNILDAGWDFLVR